MKANPRILLTNDDGINADGLRSLEKIARELSNDVWIVAPEQEQSGAGHSLTLHVPVRLRKIEEKRYAVSGTPTDCVMIAVKQILSKQKFDLILSGVNRGSNAADDITYSGTVAGAMEGTVLDIPSVALSLLYDDPERVQWKTAESHAPALIRTLVNEGWPKDTFINLNFPDLPPEQVKGVKVCPQGKRLVSVALSERMDPKGRPYFWIGGAREDTPDREGVDIDWLNKGYITVTPLRMEMTDYKVLDRLRVVLAHN